VQALRVLVVFIGWKWIKCELFTFWEKMREQCKVRV